MSILCEDCAERQGRLPRGSEHRPVRSRFWAVIGLLLLSLVGLIPVAWHMVPRGVKARVHCAPAAVNYSDCMEGQLGR